MITREQWREIKEGDVLMSPDGIPRLVAKGPKDTNLSTATLYRLSQKRILGNTVTGCYTALKNHTLQKS